MKSLAKRKCTSFGMFFLCFILALSFPIKVYAWEAHLDENGNIKIYTVDKKRTTNIWYYTEGVTITRCKYDPVSQDIHESNDWFITKLTNAKDETKSINGKEICYNTWQITMDDLISITTAQNPSWGKEITNAVEGTGPAVYVKLDCVVWVVNDDIKKRYGPYMNVPGFGGSDGHLNVGVGQDGSSIAKHGFNIENGLKTHYNHYLLIGNGMVEEPKEYPDELVTYDYTMDHYAGIDENQPAFAMSNYSSEFNLHDGIPSSENIDNTFLADSWYGNTKVYSRIVSKSYTHSITYRWTINNGYYAPVDKNKDGIYESYGWVDDFDTYSESRLLNIGTGYAAFQYLADTHIHDFTNADIENGAYPGDHIYYNDTHEVPMTCIGTSEYKNVASSQSLITTEPDWLANTKDHLTMGSFTYKNSYDFGIVQKKPDIDAQAAKDILAIRDIISRNTKTRNDKLVIDGHTFMNNDWVSGCNFFDGVPSSYTQCTQSSAWVHDYLQKTGTKPLHAYDPADITGASHVQIPPTVDNGQYPTSMKVYYQRLVTYSKTATTFEAD